MNFDVFAMIKKQITQDTMSSSEIHEKANKAFCTLRLKL